MNLHGKDGAREDAFEQLVHGADLIMIFVQGPKKPKAPLFPRDAAAMRQIDHLECCVRRSAWKTRVVRAHKYLVKVGTSQTVAVRLGDVAYSTLEDLIHLVDIFLFSVSFTFFISIWL